MPKLLAAKKTPRRSFWKITALFCGAAAFVPWLDADAGEPQAPIPQLMLPASEGGWSGFIVRGADPTVYLPEDYLKGSASLARAESLGAPPAKVAAYLHARTFNEWIPPESGIGPVTDGPEHPFYNNAVAAILGKNSTYRIADLNSEAAKNLMPWAIDVLKKQNAIVMTGKNGETRQARCWETGVPDIHEAPQSLYFLQTPAKIILYQGGRVRHIYMNVPHTKNPKPSWYGESVGHYEGDTLVVDTIGFNDKSFVDGFRTPHTTQLHVVERFKVINGGKALDVSFTVDDPGTFYKPWGARRPRYRTADRENATGRMEEDACAANNDDVFHQGFEPVPSADKPDF